MTFVSNPNRDKFLFSYSHNIENWYVFIQSMVVYFMSIPGSRFCVCFCSAKGLILAQLCEEREKISKTFQFQPKKIYYRPPQVPYIVPQQGEHYELGNLSLDGLRRKLFSSSIPTGQSDSGFWPLPQSFAWQSRAWIRHSCTLPTHPLYANVFDMANSVKLYPQKVH